MCSLRSPVWSAAIKIVVHDEPVSSKSRWARREHTYNTQKLRGTLFLTFPQKNKNRRVQSVYPRPAHNIFRPIRADLCPGVGRCRRRVHAGTALPESGARIWRMLFGFSRALSLNPLGGESDEDEGAETAGSSVLQHKRISSLYKN